MVLEYRIYNLWEAALERDDISGHAKKGAGQLNNDFLHFSKVIYPKPCSNICRYTSREI